jgi:hypothetical protein
VAGAVPPPSAPAQRSKADLTKLVEPIALHPDPLLATILPAAVYPLEIVQAARFVKDTNNIAKLDQQPWDENVKAVARFPQLIAMLDKDLDWTVELGQAFLDQPKELMDAIQSLRAKAHQAGTLQSTTQQVVTVTNVVVVETNVTQVVTVTNQVVQVQPANPEVIYVPTYPPTVYYPPPGYVYDPYAPLVTFGVGLAVGAIIANNCDWHGGGIWVGGGGMVIWGGGGYHGDVDIDIDQDITIDRGERPTRPTGDRPANTSASSQKWQPDQNRLRSSGVPSTTQNREARGWGGPSAQPAQRGGSLGAGTSQPSYNWSQRPTTGTQPARSPGVAPSPTPAQRPSSTARPGSTSTGPSTANRSSAAARPSPSQSPGRSNTAFNGVNHGSSAYNAGNRGAASRGSASRGGGARGGARGR